MIVHFPSFSKLLHGIVTLPSGTNKSQFKQEEVASKKKSNDVKKELNKYKNVHYHYYLFTLIRHS